MENDARSEKIEQIGSSAGPLDRRGRIKGMGVFQIVLGSLTSLFLFIGIAGLLLGSAFAQAAGAEQPSLFASFASLGIYAIAALFFFVVGIGSIKLRRWSRPLVLAFMWPTLIFGILGFAFGLVFLPTVFNAMPVAEGPNPELQKEIMSAMSAVLNAVIFIACVVIPALHIFIYQPTSIRDTLERFDTKPRFTDKCPTPVFGIVVSLISIGLMQLSTIWIGAALFFNTSLTGPFASVLLAVEALTCFVLARFAFKCHRAGFWGTIAFMLYLGGRNAIGFLTVGFMDFLIASKAATGQSAAIVQEAFAQIPIGPVSAAFWAIAGLSAAGYVFYQRKYFQK